MNKKLNKGLRDIPKTSVPSREYLDNWERIFGKSVPNGNKQVEKK